MESWPLTIIGDVSVDIVLGPLREWPRVGTETLLEKSELRAGGSAGNAALAVHYLGARARLISRVGNDDFGAWLARQFDGVDAALPPCDAPTSVSIGLVHACSERTFLSTHGHLERLTYRDVRPSLARADGTGSILLLSGVFLTPELRKSYDALIDDAGRLGYEVALDTGWPPQGWTEATRAEVSRWISRCDHVLLNELEVTSLAAMTDLTDASAALVQSMKPGASLVVKTGERGAIGIQGGAQVSSEARKAAVFDTIGAGDCFNAGYLLARSRGDDLAGAVAAGCHAATAIISHFPRREIRHGGISLAAPLPAAREYAS